MTFQKVLTRRSFVSTLATGATGILVGSPLWSAWASAEPKTIQDVIDLLLSEPGVSYPQTVDTIKSGNPAQPLKGVVTTFMANDDVIKKTIDLGANLIVTHEPTYYNHEDKTDWIAQDAVYKFKRKLLDDHNIVVFRYHDYIHSIKPDPVVMGVVEKLGWQPFVKADNPRIVTLPSRKLSALCKEVKTKLGAEQIRYIGSEDMNCSKVGLMVGASGGNSHISMLGSTDIDVIIVGEIHEWETSEYIRDAISAGQNRALIVAGHAPTEEPGMAWLAKWLQPQLKDVKVTHVPGVSPFKYLD
jgi:putative NIF3 family GTP cyclohydrolase 1 type 2